MLQSHHLFFTVYTFFPLHSFSPSFYPLPHPLIPSSLPFPPPHPTPPNRDPDYKPAATEVKLHDFDQAAFFVEVLPEDLKTIIISLSLPCYHQIKDKGADDAVKAAFGAMVRPTKAGYDATIALTPADYQGKEEQIIELASRFKRVALSGVFDHFLQPLSAGKSGSLSNFKFDLRQDTTVYILPGADRVTVGYRLSFIDRADNEIGRVFLREFADPSLRRKVQRAPIVDFDVQPQVALKAFGVDRASATDLGFITFTILPSHCTEALRPKVVESLQIFRNFVQYHLKCAKSYMNSRIRLRVVEFIKFLNRAKRNTEGNQPKRILTAAGKLKLG
jgi:actin related protein 2/3 complex subunit 2